MNGFVVGDSGREVSVEVQAVLVCIPVKSIFYRSFSWTT